MKKEKIISILRELWRYKDTDKYSESEIRTALESAISALSADGEYIKKSELLGKTVRKNSIWNEVTNSEGKGLEEIVNDLPTYSFPETAKPEEGAELIDRRQIEWYGCDHEGRIKGINCETADCSKCFYATVEHDEVMSLPVYRIPGSADIEKAREEIEKIRAEVAEEACLGMNDRYCQGLYKALRIIDKHIGGK